MCRPRGTLVLKSTAAGGKPLNLAPVVVDEITVLGSRCGPFRPAVKALAERAVDVTSLVSRRMKLSDGVAAMAGRGVAGLAQGDPDDVTSKNPSQNVAVGVVATRLGESASRGSPGR